jgi:hypothetical protein
MVYNFKHRLWLELVTAFTRQFRRAARAWRLFIFARIISMPARPRIKAVFEMFLERYGVEV